MLDIPEAAAHHYFHSSAIDWILLARMETIDSY